MQTAITCIELEPSLIELLVLLQEEEIEEFLGFPLSQIFNDLSSSLLASIIDRGFSVQVWDAVKGSTFISTNNVRSSK